jgi:hypothetical protein
VRFEEEVVSITGHELLDLCNGPSGIEALWTRLGTIHAGMASVNRKGILKLCSSLLAILITRIVHPSICLQQYGRSQILVRVPPVRGTAG